MAGLVIDADRCIGCKRCERACATAGIEVVDRLARPTEGCVLCGACVDACPVGAISLVRDEVTQSDLGTYHDIWVFAQVDRDGYLMPVARELTAKARELAVARGCEVVALVAEGELADDAVARELIACGADRVLRARDERFTLVDPELLANWVCALARVRRPEIVLFGATPLGRELAPRVAAELKTGLTADCTALSIDAETGLLHQTRPAFGGNLMATIMCPAHRPQMATVRPGVFAAPELDSSRTGAIDEAPLDAGARSRVRTLAFERATSSSSIAQAKRLVVVGRGIGSKKNLPLMERLAELLGAQIGCTRPLVEAGWLDYAHQVGQTGVAVAPELLVSIGVSGAIQHLAGISGAGTVIAVNEDAQAPIFGAAQYRVVGDAVEVVEELVAALEARDGAGMPPSVPSAC